MERARVISPVIHLREKIGIRKVPVRLWVAIVSLFKRTTLNNRLKILKCLKNSSDRSRQGSLRCRDARQKILRDGALKNLRGGGRSTKKKFAQGKRKLNEKNSCTPSNPKKYSCYGLKKIHTRNLIMKKIPAARKFPPPPHKFSNCPSLSSVFVLLFLI